MISDLVTKFDIDTENELKNALGKAFPDIGFYGEETGGTLNGTFWLVDPIDGTQHFVRGLPFCSTMLALIKDGEPVFSVINLFATQEVFVAEKGKGAVCNDSALKVSSRPLIESFISFESNPSVVTNAEIRKSLKSKTWFLQTLNAGFEFAMVASGKLDGRIQLDPYGGVHDYAAGALLVREAGGVVANIGSANYDFKNFNFLATNPVVYRELTEGEGAIFANG
ncbi:MAG: inositol monophosphatase [Patescibacteria group bacterium]